MAFKKGQSGNPKGKPVGALNKVSSTVKQKFVDVFLDLQVAPQFALREWAMSSPQNLTEFYKMATKLFPVEISAEVAHSYVMRTPEVAKTVDDWQEQNPQVTLQ